MINFIRELESVKTKKLVQILELKNSKTEIQNLIND